MSSVPGVSIDLTRPFRGSAALAAGLLTRGRLRGRRFQRLFPDVYAPAELKPDLALRSAAAAVLVEGRGVLAGYSAAEMLGASCGPADAPAEILLLRPGRQSYRCSGLRVHRDLVDPAEIIQVGPYAVTSPARTAFDLIRWVPTFREKVVAVDALAFTRGVDPADVLHLRLLHWGARGVRHVVPVLGMFNGRAESPMETRIRLVSPAGSPLGKSADPGSRCVCRSAALVPGVLGSSAGARSVELGRRLVRRISGGGH